MMKHIATASLIALAAASVLTGAPLAAQTAPGDFRLPTPTPTPTDVQGPVDPDSPILTRPRDTTPTPRPTAAPAPTPTATPRPAATATPRIVQPPRDSSLPPRFTPPAAPTPRESEAVVSGSTEAFPTSTTEVVAPLPSTGPAVTGTTAAPVAVEDGSAWWPYALGGLVAAIGAVAGLLAWRRRRPHALEEAPEIERPVVAAPPPSPSNDTPPAQAVARPLVIEARAVRMSRSLLYTTLSYTIVATNRGAKPLESVRLGADLVTAHARIPTEQQLADPLVALDPVREIDRLEPGESVEVDGELRLPIKDIRPIPHGRAVVYVPLLRVRGEAVGLDPVARTFLVGLRQAGAGPRLQPFRLDELPQTYHTVGQTALD